MRTLTDDTRAAMTSYVKDGPFRYLWRATVELTQMKRYPYDTEFAPGGDYGHDRARTGRYSSIIFGGAVVHELPNIKSGQIVRDLDQDIAELQLTLLNTAVAPMGDAEESAPGLYDIPGALSYSRGVPTVDENRWDHLDTGWRNLLVPDRVIKTYEGYGTDPSKAPGHDPNMYISGVWMIDTVALNDDGDLVIKARDLLRLLNDYIAMPPDIPWDSYPMEWSKIQSVTVPGRGPTGGDWWEPAPRSSGHHKIVATSSNQLYVDSGIDDTPTYVNSRGNVLGHREADALRDDGYWLSTGQAAQGEMVWWEMDLDDPIDMSAIRLYTWGGPFVVYVSVHTEADGWVGRKKIPYSVGDVLDSDGDPVNLGARIRFVHRERFEREQREDIILPRKYRNVDKIRITFTRLRRHPGARVYPWRAGLRRLKVYKGNYADLGFGDVGRLKAVGNYSDYTDVIKWICAWGGFWWPQRDAQCVISYGPDEADDVQYGYEGEDRVLSKGTIWGALKQTGTAGVVDLTADQFDKQPLLDAVQVVRNIVGFNFYADEAGGVVWRNPNLYESGNWVMPDHLNHNRKPTYAADVHEVIDETDVLLQYSTTLDSTNLRERIGVAASNGKVGTVIRGYKPYETGLLRIAVWTDEHFESNRECRVAADMIAAQQMFSFRRSSTTIPPNPAIQIDDQVRIYEQTTNETFFHYVTGVTMTYDADNPQNNRYALESHWLGERISDAWVVRVNQLDAFTQQFLNNLGPID